MKIILDPGKWLFILTLILALAWVAACSSSPSTTLATTTPPAQTTSSTPTSPTSSAVPSTTPAPSQSPSATPAATPSATSTPTSTSTPSPTPSASGQAMTINLTAQNIAFDKSYISVPAGASVTINFNNKDSGIPHNVAVYQKMADGQVKPVFIGDTISGPSTIVYHFTAPTAQGSYFFDCDVHPQIMVGSFVITP